jgi:hypothetical protein
MRIFFSPDGSDPMLLDTKAGLHTLHEQLRAFLASSASSVELVAEMDRSPAPYEEFLGGLRLLKTNGDLRLTLGSDRWLTLEGPSAELAECAKRFLAKDEQGHTHLYTTPISLIIESDSICGEEFAS